jgi:hypothetical protein
MRICDQVMDFFTGGYRTRRIQEVEQMNRDIKLGAQLMGAGVGWWNLLLHLLFCLCRAAVNHEHSCDALQEQEHQAKVSG